MPLWMIDAFRYGGQTIVILALCALVWGMFLYPAGFHRGPEPLPEPPSQRDDVEEVLDGILRRLERLEHDRMMEDPRAEA